MSTVQPRRPASIDIIRDGVSGPDLRRGGTRAVWGALVSTAASKQQQGWDYQTWASTLDEAQSRLGNQARLDNRRREINALAYEKNIQRAWDAAAKWLAEDADPVRGREEIAAEAVDLLNALDRVPPDAWLLGGRERKVLRHVLATAARLGTTTPAVPARATAEVLDIAPMTVTRALASLTNAGLLQLVERGTRGAAIRKASRYCVSPTLHTYLCPYGAMSTTPPYMSTTPESVGCTTAPYMSTTPEESSMITITRDPNGRITAAIPAEGGDLATLARVLAEAGIRVVQPTRENGAPTVGNDPAGQVFSLAERRAAAGGTR